MWCYPQAQEELEILHYSPSIMVYQDHSSHYQAIHQVKNTSLLAGTLSVFVVVWWLVHCLVLKIAAGSWHVLKQLRLLKIITLRQLAANVTPDLVCVCLCKNGHFLCTCLWCLSTKFSSKIKYVNSLDELQELIPMDCIQIPECIIRWVPLNL